MKTLKKVSFVFLFASLLLSCSSDDDTPPVPVNEEEVITTLTVSLTRVGSFETVTLISRDLDGDGPNAPEITVSGPLECGTSYNGNLLLLNETTSPSEVINEEIEEEADEHQFFYQATNGLATFIYEDSDANGKPIGLDFTLNTSATAGTGTITVILRHELNKDGAGVSGGDIANAGGETDIQVSFPVEVQ